MSYPLFLASSVQDRLYDACFNHGENTQAFQAVANKRQYKQNFCFV